MVKDYYKILDLGPGANQKDIKKNFRRLALRYHPDKNPGNKYALAWYQEIKEAYETLTDENLLKAYLQERWLLKSRSGNFDNSVPLTPDFILTRVMQLEREIAQMDHFRMSHEQLQGQLVKALSDDQVEALIAFDDQVANKAIAQTLLQASGLLEHKYLIPVFQQIQKLAVTDNEIMQMLTTQKRKRDQQHILEKYQAWFILLLSVLLCVCIYFVNK